MFISGRGSNLQAILNAIESGLVSAQVKVVISDRPGALGLECAQKNHIPAYGLDVTSFDSKRDYECEVVRLLHIHGVELVVLAGYMRIVSETLLQAYLNKIINIHPSLLPAFKGLHTHERALKLGVKFSGCTVHYVNEGLDEGQIIAQAVVPVLPSDTVETLSERVLKEEHRLLPEVIQSIALDISRR